MGHRNWTMPAGGRVTAPAAHRQSAGRFSGKSLHKVGSGKSTFNKEVRGAWYLATPLILLLSIGLWAMMAGGIAWVVQILSP